MSSRCAWLAATVMSIPRRRRRAPGAVPRLPLSLPRHPIPRLRPACRGTAPGKSSYASCVDRRLHDRLPRAQPAPCPAKAHWRVSSGLELSCAVALTRKWRGVGNPLPAAVTTAPDAGENFLVRLT